MDRWRKEPAPPPSTRRSALFANGPSSSSTSACSPIPWGDHYRSRATTAAPLPGSNRRSGRPPISWQDKRRKKSGLSVSLLLPLASSHSLHPSTGDATAKSRDPIQALTSRAMIPNQPDPLLAVCTAGWRSLLLMLGGKISFPTLVSNCSCTCGARAPSMLVNTLRRTASRGMMDINKV